MERFEQDYQQAREERWRKEIEALRRRLNGEDKPLDQRTHSQLLQARAATSDPVMQEILAPQEHRQYAREAVRENPLMAAPIAVATPGYYLAKKLGVISGQRTKPSAQQVFAGLTGVGQGLGDAYTDFMSRFKE